MTDIKYENIIKINGNDIIRMKMIKYIDVLKTASDNNWNNVLIIEDNVDVKDIIHNFIDKYIDNYDVLQLILPENYKIIYNHTKPYHDVIESDITFSLLINSGAYKNLLQNYINCLEILHDDEIDKYWNTIQKNYDWYIPDKALIMKNSEYIEYPIQKQSYVSVNIVGGLGNQLFMIACIHAIGYKYGLIPIVKYIAESPSIFKNRDTYFDNIFKKVLVISPDKYNKISFNKITEDKYNKAIINNNNNYELSGYYQSESHITEYADKILELFSLDDNYINKIQNIYDNIKGENKTTVSMHIRRGDYVKLSHYHTNLTIRYYNSAAKLFDKNVLFIIFSDDIIWCKNNIKYPNMYFCENIPDIGLPVDITELMLMSICDNNIIANSTFSWWGAWLNKNKNKTVIAPRNWFVDDVMNVKNRKIYCKNWRIV